MGYFEKYWGRSLSQIRCNARFAITKLKLFDRQNQLRFVYTHFKSCDQFHDRTSLHSSNIFHAMKTRGDFVIQYHQSLWFTPQFKAISECSTGSIFFNFMEKCRKYLRYFVTETMFPIYTKIVCLLLTKHYQNTQSFSFLLFLPLPTLSIIFCDFFSLLYI